MEENNKHFFLVGYRSRTIIRIKASDILNNLRQIMTSGYFKAITNSSKWSGYETNKHLYFEMFMYKDQLKDFINRLNLTRLSYDEVDMSVLYNGENQQLSPEPLNDEIIYI
jgi:hypothetical protein